MTHHHPLRHLALPALLALVLSGAPSSHAMGHLADVRIIDRDSGETLQVVSHQGEYWVAGRPGARYAVALRNTGADRMMAVVSVDGVNVVTGDTAATGQTGYVLNAWQSYDITGWRKSDTEVAAFHFTRLPESYAARTGRPAHVGMIGVAVFRERTAPPEIAPVRPRWRERRELSESERSQLERSEPASPPVAAESPAPGNGGAKAASPREATDTMRRHGNASRLGTGHGAREKDRVGHTRFERRSAQPEELIVIRYDSRANLMAMGVLPHDEAATPPLPFPGSPHRRYAPDPD
jgi:hypothetical protein